MRLRNVIKQKISFKKLIRWKYGALRFIGWSVYCENIYYVYSGGTSNQVRVCCIRRIFLGYVQI